MLRITLLEFNPVWEAIEENLQALTLLTNNLETQLLVLPEMFATGFSMNPSKISQEETGSIVEWMKGISLQKNMLICGSIAIREKEKYYNTFYAVANGKIMCKYKKRHLFAYGKEDDCYEKGNERVTFEYEDWCICPMICYDLRFPVWSRNDMEYDILLNVANWPTSRIETWKILHQARAIENQCYSIGCNRTGIDGNKLEYNGNSLVVNPLGHIISPIRTSENIIQYSIYKKELDTIRKQFPFLVDRDSFAIHNHL